MSIPAKVLGYGLAVVLIALGLLSIAQDRPELATFAGMNVVGWYIGFAIGRRSR
jgi:hypothetical protein